MIKQALIGAMALALCSAAAQAGENRLTRQEGTGMLSGAAAGALVGGPVGAAVGLMVGGILGDSIGTAQRADARAQRLEEELIDTRIALAKASERTGGDEMLDALAARLHADVMFRTGSAQLDTDAGAKLEELGKLLAAHQQLKIELHGFADPRGNSEKNLTLSHERAGVVREALLKGGAAPEQIELAAHGEDLTTAPQGDLEAYAWERRVRVSIRPVTTAVAQSR